MFEIKTDSNRQYIRLASPFKNEGSVCAEVSDIQDGLEACYHLVSNCLRFHYERLESLEIIKQEKVSRKKKIAVKKIVDSYYKREVWVGSATL